MLFLSWAGRSLRQHLTLKNKAVIFDQVTDTLRALHKQSVLHTDVELRNWLWDEQRDCLMLVDFERAEIRVRSPLGALSPNRKRNRGEEIKFKMKDDEFEREIRRARELISRCIT